MCHNDSHLSCLDFKEHGFYPMEFIENCLGGSMTLRTFLERLNLSCTGKDRMFEGGLWGWEVLEALDKIRGNRNRPAASRPPASRNSMRGSNQPISIQEVH